MDDFPGQAELGLRASLGIRADPRSAGRARRFIADFCAAARLGEEACQVAALLTSELVTNAVRYGGSRAVLEAQVPGGCGSPSPTRTRTCRRSVTRPP